MKWPAIPFVFLLALYGGGFLFCQSNTFLGEALQERYDLTSQLYILAIDRDTLGVEELSRPEWEDRFVPFPAFLDKNYPGRSKDVPIRLDAEKTYWTRIRLVNQLPPDCRLEDWYLFTGKSDRTVVYLVDPDGVPFDSMLTGFLVPARQKDFSFGNQNPDRVSLNVFGQRDSTTVFCKSQSIYKRKPWVDFVLTREDYYHSWNEVKKIQNNWLFIGFLLTFFSISLLLYIVTRDTVFLFHSLFQLGVFIYLLEFFAILLDLPVIRDNPGFMQIIIYLALALMDIFYLLFIRAFLNLKETNPLWDKIVKGLTVIRVFVFFLVATIYYGFYNMPLADNISAFFVVIEYFGMVIFLAVSRKGGPQRLFLLGGTLVLTVGIVANAISVVMGTGLQISYLQFGGFGEVILFTLGLGYRMKTLIQEQRKVMVLKETDEFKTRFYTNITHEFRTPLTVIQGFADQLGKELDDPKQLNKLTLIKQNGDRLVRLLNRILDLSKLQSGKMDLNLRQRDIIEFLRYIVSSFQSFAWTKGIHMVFLTDMERFEMDFDAEKIQDVMTNLISNAIKFTAEEGKISVLVKLPAAGPHKDELMIQVKDTGIGMAKEDLDHLFERFYRSSAVRKKGQGTGLGLSFTRELVKLMNGSIEVSSKPGAGSAFSVFLPVSRQAPEAEVENPSGIEVDLEKSAEQQPFTPSRYDEEKPLALIVEDSYDVVLYLRELLEKDFNIVVAYDGAEGIEKAISLIPDVVLSDVMMPEKDGLELCETLKTDERTSHIPIILATAKASVEDRLTGLRRGADAYLSKPFNQEELSIYLQNFIHLRKKLQERYSKMQAGRSPAVEPRLKEFFEVEDVFVAKLRSIVEKNLDQEGFGASQLAQETGMSRSQLHRKITALTGHPASNFINAIRIQTARELLLHTDLTVSEVAYHVGLEPNYFSRLFKEETGQTPGEFRANQAEK